AAVRIWMGICHRRWRWKTQDREQAQPGHAADGRSAGADRRRCMGACLLLELSEPAGRLPQGLGEMGGLGKGRRALGLSQEWQSRDLNDLAIQNPDPGHIERATRKPIFSER